ncbi:hypothetical protein C4585_01480 [Candidatus Parcubacteria bacterium]|nr:MAG: hypothetical protein C4585_01480 [Candidatus Parcubacteria bacterium]
MRGDFQITTVMLAAPRFAFFRPLLIFIFQMTLGAFVKFLLLVHGFTFMGLAKWNYTEFERAKSPSRNRFTDKRVFHIVGITAFMINIA